MSAYFSNLASQQDVLQTQYFLNSKLNSYHQSPENMMYLNATSMPGHDCTEAQSVENREEMLFIAPHGNPVMMQPINGQLNFAPNYSDSNAVAVDPQDFSGKMFHSQGLSLSLGNQEMPSYQNQYTNSGLSSMLSSHVEHSGDNIAQSSELRTAEYLSFDLAGPINNSHQSSMYPKGMTRDLKLHEETVISGAIYNSRYLKAAQELLDEVVNLHQAIKQSDKSHDFHSSAGHVVSEDTKLKSDELSPSERNDLQNKMTKLLSMLEEVDRRYKQYCQQMQVVVSSFEIVAGCGSGKSYTALARQTISRQFRSLRDAIKNQIQAVQQSLGDEGGAGAGNQVVGLSRLRYIDQQLRQQRALLQFGVMRQPWRPQRGLPETAVSVLRAWLFEHFLHPYPKDSEKIMLARQTGLTRGQVANWFINARVRLWKPMIEEMYKEEFADMEADSKSSQEHAARLKSESEDTTGDQEPRESLRNDFSSSFKADASYTARLGLQSSSFEEEKMENSGINKSRREEMNNYQVSLALGLQHSEQDDDAAAAAAAAVAIEKADYYCLDAMNQQERFSNPHLLSDFVL